MDGYKKWGVNRSLVNKNVGFHQMQLSLAKNPEMEARDMYAKPGTATAKRQDDPWSLSYPISRYTSSNP